MTETSTKLDTSSPLMPVSAREKTDELEELDGLARHWLLFDPAAQPQNWNERMSEGEFAVLYSGVTNGAGGGAAKSIAGAGPFCTIFPDRWEAEAYARQQVAALPRLRCRVYGHEGFGSEPVAEVRGADFKPESDISPRFRRWVGCTLLFGGLTLTLVDWLAGFRYGWPAMVGTRMMPTGLVLLVIEAGIQLNAWDARRRLGRQR